MVFSLIALAVFICKHLWVHLSGPKPDLSLMFSCLDDKVDIGKIIIIQTSSQVEVWCISRWGRVLEDHTGAYSFSLKLVLHNRQCRQSGQVLCSRTNWISTQFWYLVAKCIKHSIEPPELGSLYVRQRSWVSSCAVTTSKVTIRSKDHMKLWPVLSVPWVQGYIWY